MADTSRGDYPDKFCAYCGKQGDCYLKHWGPLMRGHVVYLDECAAGPLRSIGGEGIEPRFDSNTGEALEVQSK